MKKGEGNKWTCPKCGRAFEREGQAHSCRIFPLEEHFKGKPRGKILYEKFKSETEKRIGEFTVDSPACCIHFVGMSTFVAVKIFKEKIQVECSLCHPLESKRVAKFVPMSANRYTHYIDLKTEAEFDDELMGWVREAYYLTK
jgi:Domain of unknown function (DUF5655)